MSTPAGTARVLAIAALVAIAAPWFVAFPRGQAAPGPSRQAAATSSRPTWPPPPSQARIRFVRTLNPAAVRGRPSLFSRFLNVLTGGEAVPTMSQPYGIAVGPDRRVYVADTVGGIIHVYNLQKSDYSSIKVAAQSLVGIAFAGNRMYVTDSASGRLLCLDARGRTQWVLGPKNGFARPTGIAAAKDRLFVVDTLNHRVAVVSLSGDILETFGTRGGGPGEFNFPTNIARSADGRLFVTDAMNFRVQVLDEAGRPLRTFGRVGDGAGDFDKPKGIALDSTGHVYVVEGLNDVVQIFDDTGKLLLAFGGSGFGEGQFWLPSGISIVNDIVYVADAANRRVQMFEYVAERP